MGLKNDRYFDDGRHLARFFMLSVCVFFLLNFFGCKTPVENKRTQIGISGKDQPSVRRVPTEEGPNTPTTDTAGNQFYKLLSSDTSAFVGRECERPRKTIRLRKSGAYALENAFLMSSFFSGTEKYTREELTKMLEASGFDKIAWVIDEGVDVFSFIAVNKELAVVHFRGTSNLNGWLKNSVVLPVQASRDGFGLKGKIHKGFFDAYKTVKEEFERKLAESVDKDLPLYFTGHSLGGALTTVAGARAALEGFQVASVYTGGQPRLGDAEFSSYVESLFSGNHFRLVYEDDMVARIPPTSQGSSEAAKLLVRQRLFSQANGVLQAVVSPLFQNAGYVHLGKQLLLGQEGVRLQPSVSTELEDLEFWSKWGQQLNVIAGAADIFSTDLIKDHASIQYMCSLSREVNKSF